mmetsp:Transcript_7044/g.11698  ORF Transcript_7044/g.11698 Transcript_7044/m.11698 type:complete len:163 (+) Transcript_7044:65-553(+)
MRIHHAKVAQKQTTSNFNLLSLIGGGTSTVPPAISRAEFLRMLLRSRIQTTSKQATRTNHYHQAQSCAVWLLTRMASSETFWYFAIGSMVVHPASMQNRNAVTLKRACGCRDSQEHKIHFFSELRFAEAIRVSTGETFHGVLPTASRRGIHHEAGSWTRGYT